MENKAIYFNFVRDDVKIMSSVSDFSRYDVQFSWFYFQLIEFMDRRRVFYNITEGFPQNVTIVTNLFCILSKPET
jgi:hypothetical protein